MLRCTSRAAVREEVFHHWIKEQPGTPTTRNTYRYDVEVLSNGKRIYLTRPTRLNKGADFVILCEGFTRFKNGNDKPPKHGDLLQEIAAVCALSSENRTEMLNALQRIWDCENSKTIISELVFLKGNLQAERALLLSKWFFIEQDVTYWTESGRHMLRTAIESNFGKLP
jgi:hypothetical protein